MSGALPPRDPFASYAGVAPIELSSGGRIVHRLSRRGDRQLNHAIHMMAICQIRQTNSEGRIYFERKVAEGKTKREAIRSSSATSATPSIGSSSSTHRSKGPGGQAGTTHSLRGRLCTLAVGSSAKSLPDPPNLRQPRPSMAAWFVAPGQPRNCPLDSKRIR